jgi:hypothetical protein
MCLGCQLLGLDDKDRVAMQKKFARQAETSSRDVSGYSETPSEYSTIPSYMSLSDYNPSYN